MILAGSNLHKSLRFLACITVLLMPGSLRVHGQELRPPQRWDDTFRNVLPLYRQDTLSVCFIGDIMMHQSQIDRACTGGTYDFSTYFSLIEDRLSKADLTVANMEFSLGGEPYAGYPAFSAPDTIADYAADCGIDVFLCANNHIYDRGATGAERTLERYRQLGVTHGISFTGIASDEEEREANWPLIISRKGMRVALLNVTYGTNGGLRLGWPKVNYMDDRPDLILALERAEEKETDMIIALPHWGEEYELCHSAQQAETAEWLIQNGVDMIIGTHPHVVQDTEVVRGNRYDEAHIVYSLGNAVSNMSARNAQLELMVTTGIIRHCNGDTEIIPPEYTFLWCSRPGGYNNGYTVIPIADFIGRRELWQGGWDYDNMKATYERVRQITGIKDTTDIDEQ